MLVKKVSRSEFGGRYLQALDTLKVVRACGKEDVQHRPSGLVIDKWNPTLVLFFSYPTKKIVLR